jgi:hypothetical protein
MILRIDSIASGATYFVARLRLPAPVADDDPIDERRQQVVHPLRLGALLERDMPGRIPRMNSVGAPPSVGGPVCAHRLGAVWYAPS